MLLVLDCPGTASGPRIWKIEEKAMLTMKGKSVTNRDKIMVVAVSNL